jgi:hypothetical protein
MIKECKMELAPIVLFVYNRPWHTQQTVEALQKNELADRSDLFIYSDGPKDEQSEEAVQKVRKYIHTIDGFKTVTIRKREKNLGLADSIIDGVSKVVNKYGRVIVLEDDLVTSPYFLKFINEGLEFYKEKKEVMSISGYNHPKSIMPVPDTYREDIYFNYRNSSWGWATWNDRWEKVDWDVKDFEDFINNRRLKKRFNRGGNDMAEMLQSQMEGEIDSWAIRFSYAHFKNNCLSVCPINSHIENIGHDGTGEHCGVSMKYCNDLIKAKENVDFLDNSVVDKELLDNFRKIYKRGIEYKMKQLVKKIYNYHA